MLLYAAARRVPEQEPTRDLDRAIRYAATLYDRLTAAGHTADSRPDAAARTPKTRKTPDHLASLTGEQAADFEAFYRAYGVLKGKQRAAARWAEIAPDAALARRIRAAAAADAAAPRPADAVRKYPEGWLAERRWEDIPEPAVDAADGPARARAAEVRELLAERLHLARLIAADTTSAASRGVMSQQLADIVTRLDALGVGAETLNAPVESPRPARGRPVMLADIPLRSN